MGKGSNTKQRKRRSSAAKTKIPRQNKNSHKAFWRPAKFASEVVKASWNPRISHRQNLAHLGLNPSPNAALGKRGGVTASTAATRSAVAAAAEVEFAAIPASDPNLLARGDDGHRNHRRRPMPDSEQRYVSALIKAHGEDYSAMSFDIGLNLRQFTEAKLRSMCARFALLDEAQRCADL